MFTKGLHNSGNKGFMKGTCRTVDYWQMENWKIIISFSNKYIDRGIYLDRVSHRQSFLVWKLRLCWEGSCQGSQGWIVGPFEDVEGIPRGFGSQH
jgi:hypothetical protein